LISTDGGATFSTLLANTLNDGNHIVTMPATPAVNCRILVEAVGNIFYAVSPNFSIGYTITNVCNSYTMNTGFAIPDDDPAFTVRSINVPTTTNISDVNLAVNLTHTYVEDLQIVLQGPMTTTTQSTVFSQSCTNNDNINATFDDQGTGIVCATTITGNVTPSTPLSIFNGLNPNGNWLVAIRDVGTSDSGNVVSYTLTICSQTASLSSDSFGLENFTLYPNPNNGNFTIQFNSNSGNEIKINVHDIRGREIYSKSYTNDGLFNENLQLSNAQSGIYLVTVQDGSRKEVKKIVIE
jgi:subtilisin-like proprotein convertase family protein